MVSKRNLIWSAPYWYLNKLWQHFKFYVNTKYVAGVYRPIIFNLFVFLKKILDPKIWKTIETQILFKNFSYLGFLFGFYWRNYTHVVKSQLASCKVWKDGSYLPLASISPSPKVSLWSLLVDCCVYSFVYKEHLKIAATFSPSFLALSMKMRISLVASFTHMLPSLPLLSVVTL